VATATSSLLMASASEAALLSPATETPAMVASPSTAARQMLATTVELRENSVSTRTSS
jgi:hypothetical protein